MYKCLKEHLEEDRQEMIADCARYADRIQEKDARIAELERFSDIQKDITRATADTLEQKEKERRYWQKQSWKQKQALEEQKISAANATTRPPTVTRETQTDAVDSGADIAQGHEEDKGDAKAK